MNENIAARSENAMAKDNESRQANLKRAASNKSVVNDVFGLKKLTLANIALQLHLSSCKNREALLMQTQMRLFYHN